MEMQYPNAYEEIDLLIRKKMAEMEYKMLDFGVLEFCLYGRKMALIIKKPDGRFIGSEPIMELLSKHYPEK